MSNDEPEYYSVEEVIAETDMAILCKLDTGDEVWIPKSQIHEDSEVHEKGDAGELAIPAWLAERLDLV